MKHTVKRGDQFVQKHPDARWPLFIEVTRVARDGSWCDIRVLTWATAWTKRMPEGLQGDMANPKSPLYCEPKAWTWQDVRNSEPRVEIPL